ncbi:hypothetical protein HK100_000694 [Physocladia obscura]|uniref:Uncharacterized protein n=1 Tax=Physocladia obscura TaxID=109957 RepID=A0AAD5SY83_9FUNG|nr:hypothetical protein HK100_000694 [Physocladia obscura]
MYQAKTTVTKSTTLTGSKSPTEKAQASEMKIQLETDSTAFDDSDDEEEETIEADNDEDSNYGSDRLRLSSFDDDSDASSRYDPVKTPSFLKARRFSRLSKSSSTTAIPTTPHSVVSTIASMFSPTNRHAFAAADSKSDNGVPLPIITVDSPSLPKTSIDTIERSLSNIELIRDSSSKNTEMSDKTVDDDSADEDQENVFLAQKSQSERAEKVACAAEDDSGGVWNSSSSSFLTIADPSLQLSVFGVSQGNLMWDFLKGRYEGEKQMDDFVNLERSVMAETIDELMKNNATLSASVSALSFANSDLKDSNKHLKQTNADLLRRSEQHNTIWISLTNDIVSLQESGRAKEEAHAIEVDALKTEIRCLQTEIKTGLDSKDKESFSGTIQQLQIEKHALSEKVSVLSSHVDSCIGDAEAVIEMNEKLNTLTKENAELFNKLEEMKAELHDQQQQQSQYDSEKSVDSKQSILPTSTSLNGQNNDLGKSVEELEIANTELEIRIEQLERQVALFDYERYEVAKELDERNAKIGWLEEVNADLMAKMQEDHEGRTGITTLQSEVLSLKKKIAKLTDENDVLEALNQDLIEAKKELKTYSVELESKHAEVQAHCEFVRKAMDSMRSSHRDEIESYEAKMHDAVREQVFSQTSIFSQEIERLKIVIEDAQESQNLLNVRCKELETVRSQDIQFRDVLAQQKKELEVKVEQLEIDVQKFEQLLKTSELRGNILQKENKGLNEQLAVLRNLTEEIVVPETLEQNSEKSDFAESSSNAESD